MTTDIQNLKSFDPFAEADDTGGESKTSQQNYIHIRIQRKYTCLLAAMAQAAPAHRFLRHSLVLAFRARLTLSPHRAQWSQNPDDGPRPTQEV
jgi:hypothetical protein